MPADLRSALGLFEFIWGRSGFAMCCQKPAWFRGRSQHLGSSLRRVEE